MEEIKQMQDVLNKYIPLLEDAIRLDQNILISTEELKRITNSIKDSIRREIIHLSTQNNSNY